VKPLTKARWIAQVADELKAEDLLILDVRKTCGFADRFVLCTATSRVQMRAICDKIKEQGKREGFRSFGVEGLDTSTWIILDFGDVVVHIFSRTAREYYRLEDLWGDASVVPFRKDP
jgi:ribosome-associated protein